MPPQNHTERRQEEGGGWIPSKGLKSFLQLSPQGEVNSLCFVRIVNSCSVFEIPQKAHSHSHGCTPTVNECSYIFRRLRWNLTLNAVSTPSPSTCLTPGPFLSDISICLLPAPTQSDRLHVWEPRSFSIQADDQDSPQMHSFLSLPHCCYVHTPW